MQENESRYANDSEEILGKKQKNDLLIFQHVFSIYIFDARGFR